MNLIQTQNNSVVCDTTDMNASFNPEQGMVALFALLESLSSYVLNPDVWWLAKSDAKRVAVEKYGVDAHIFDETMEKFEKARKLEADKSILKELF